MARVEHLITIDTEFSSHLRDLGVTGRIGQEECGALKLAQICRAERVKATFFVDVYGPHAARNELLREIGLRIQDQGHDVELHTHPDGRYDRQRGTMAHYSLSEQVEILQEGKAIFAKWFGCEPIAHRAGDWGANRDVFSALRATNIPVDSSVFAGWPTCRVDIPGGPTNRPTLYEGILEIPPTVFYRRGFGLAYPYRLLSTDGQSMREVMDVIQRLKPRLPLLVSVFHSFSLLEWNARRTRYWVARHEVRKFEQFVQAIARDDEATSLTMREIYEQYRRDPASVLGGSDGVPHSSAVYLIPRALERARSAVRGALVRSLDSHHGLRPWTRSGFRPIPRPTASGVSPRNPERERGAGEEKGTTGSVRGAP